MLALLIFGLAGCGAAGEAPLVVATTWSPSARVEIEALFRGASANHLPIEWVILENGEKLASVLDRRGGVDVVLGGLSAEYAGLTERGRLIKVDPSDSSPWRTIHQPGSALTSRSGDPREDPGSFELVKSEVEEDWVKGYEKVVRLSASNSRFDLRPSLSAECVALVREGRNLDRARGLLQTLSSLGIVKPPGTEAMFEASADGLLADLLGAALVDALDELREAEAALRRYGHPAKAEASIGERPPWPPASVGKLQSNPGGELLLETLAEQVAPDPDARAWLVESWSRPKRPIDRDLLIEIAGAADGRLAREPRFRAWLRSEWTAWTRQLYRRVARVAGGYVPS